MELATVARFARPCWKHCTRDERLSCRPLRGLGGFGRHVNQGLTSLATSRRPYGTETSPRSGRHVVARGASPWNTTRKHNQAPLGATGKRTTIRCCHRRAICVDYLRIVACVSNASLFAPRSQGIWPTHHPELHVLLPIEPTHKLRRGVRGAVEAGKKWGGGRVIRGGGGRLQGEGRDARSNRRQPRERPRDLHAFDVRSGLV